MIRVLPNMVFETTNSAAFTSSEFGGEGDAAHGRDQVTATTTSGVAEVVGFDGTAVGSVVRVRLA